MILPRFFVNTWLRMHVITAGGLNCRQLYDSTNFKKNAINILFSASSDVLIVLIIKVLFVFLPLKDFLFLSMIRRNLLTDILPYIPHSTSYYNQVSKLLVTQFAPFLRNKNKHKCSKYL